MKAISHVCLCVCFILLSLWSMCLCLASTLSRVVFCADMRAEILWTTIWSTSRFLSFPHHSRRDVRVCACFHIFCVPFFSKMAEDIRPKLEACTVDLHSKLGHIVGYEIEDNKVSTLSVDNVSYMTVRFVKRAPCCGGWKCLVRAHRSLSYILTE